MNKEGKCFAFDFDSTWEENSILINHFISCILATLNAHFQSNPCWNASHKFQH